MLAEQGMCRRHYAERARGPHHFISIAGAACRLDGDFASGSNTRRARTISPPRWPLTSSPSSTSSCPSSPSDIGPAVSLEGEYQAYLDFEKGFASECASINGSCSRTWVVSIELSRPLTICFSPAHWPFVFGGERMKRAALHQEKEQRGDKGGKGEAQKFSGQKFPHNTINGFLSPQTSGCFHRIVLFLKDGLWPYWKGFHQLSQVKVQEERKLFNVVHFEGGRVCRKEVFFLFFWKPQ